jgi:hypothetical protein
MAQAEFNETVKFEADIDADGKLEFKNRSFDTKIKTWNNSYVALQMRVRIKAGKLYCRSMGGNTSLNLHYSKAFMETLQEVAIKLYDSDIELVGCGDFTIGKLGEVKGNAKYSEFDFGPSLNLSFTFYDSDLNAKETGTVKGEFKYSDINIESATGVTIDKSYDDTFKTGKISENFERKPTSIKTANCLSMLPPKIIKRAMRD